MGTLINMQPMFLLFLLLKPLQFKLITNGSLTDEEFEEHLDDTGPTRAPTKELFKAHVIIDSKRTLHDPTYCSDDMKIKKLTVGFIVLRNISSFKHHMRTFK